VVPRNHVLGPGSLPTQRGSFWTYFVFSRLVGSPRTQRYSQEGGGDATAGWRYCSDLLVVQVSAASPSDAGVTPEKKKKKRGFRMPSFASKKKDK